MPVLLLILIPFSCVGCVAGKCFWNEKTFSGNRSCPSCQPGATGVRTWPRPLGAVALFVHLALHAKCATHLCTWDSCCCCCCCYLARHLTAFWPPLSTRQQQQQQQGQRRQQRQLSHCWGRGGGEVGKCNLKYAVHTWATQWQLPPQGVLNCQGLDVRYAGRSWYKRKYETMQRLS